jgi:hypothetical protein
MKEDGKKGQVTAFIIVGILIVALGVLVYIFYPKITQATVSTENPYTFMQRCLEDDIKDVVETVSLQGGSVAPEHYIVYNGENIEYLCYTNEYYKTCVMQQPLLKPHVEEEITNEVKSFADDCFDELKKSYEDDGYNVELRKGETSVELLPKRVVVGFSHTLTLTKGETNNYDEFRVVLNNNLYEFVGIASSVLNWEARYGDAETTIYMNYYKDLKVEKKQQIEGSTIYILTDRNNGNKFQFASRSVAWPPGYG